MENIEKLSTIATQVRRDIVRMVNLAGSGHPGGSLSSADVLTALYFNVMENDPATWRRDAEGQDAFILSAGHISPVYYSVLARRGYFPVSELATFRRFGARLQGHPEVKKGLPGVFQASGSLGQGLSVAAGLALGKKLSGDSHKVYCLCGDGESEEGQIWEAGMFAVHHSLGNLIAMTDWNGQQIDGPVASVAGEGDLKAKWLAWDWRVLEADGHDMETILKTFAEAKVSDGRPTMILWKTDMGHGIGFMAGTHKWHGKVPSADQVAEALAELGETPLGDF